MCKKCYTHITELNNIFQELYKVLNITSNSNVQHHLYPIRKLPACNKNSSIGQKIKYRRRLLDIKQTELADELNVSKDVITFLENKVRHYYNYNSLVKILDILELTDKFKKQDNYIAFLLNDPAKQIRDFRMKYNLTQARLAKLLNVNMASLKRWEYKKTNLCFKNYKKFQVLSKAYKKTLK